MKKSQCLFFTRSLFFSKSQPFWGQNRPFWRLKSCTMLPYMCNFRTQLMLIRRPTCCRKQSSGFYFTKNFCKKFGIIFLYKLFRFTPSTMESKTLSLLGCSLLWKYYKYNSEIEAIELAYSDAYKMNGIKFNSQSFAPGTSKDLILNSCKQAEGAIQTSSFDFEGRYVYEVKSKDETFKFRIRLTSVVRGS